MAPGNGWLWIADLVRQNSLGKTRLTFSAKCSLVSVGVAFTLFSDNELSKAESDVQ
jgi:hypothetical protein